MAADRSSAPFEILSRLFGRLGGVMRLVLNTQLQLAKAESEIEKKRAAKVARMMAVGVGLLACAGALAQPLIVVLLVDHTPLSLAGALGALLGVDLVVGLILLNRAAAVANEREWMIDTRTRAAETIEILRG